ncbi:protein TolR [Betaproteobacteria bacterium]|nr:protein TolR [Betaproteobacteria bacterium]GHU19953.1 protein TolR [Betaproteobacteria bacterium]
MRQRRLMNQINVVPYIDVMLVLLVIFMVTAPMIQPGSIDVPAAGFATDPSQVIIIEIKKDGSHAVKESPNSPSTPISDIRFIAELQALHAKYPGHKMVVAADRNLSYQKVIDTLESARQAGITQISLLTQSGATGK